MKPGELNLNYAEYIKQTKERYDPNKAVLRNNFENSNTFLKKFKMEAGKTYSCLIPLEIALPFDPVTLEEDVFNSSNPLPLEGSPTTAVLMLKKMALDNPALAEKLCSIFGVTVDKLNLNENTISDKEIKTWHQLARIQFITGYVQHLNTRKDKFKFGRNVGADVTFNADGIVEGTKGIGYTLYEMESSLISIAIQNLQDTYNEGGINADKPKKDLADAISAMWKNRLVGNPYPIAFARVIPFAIDKNSCIDKDTLTDWKKNRKIQNLLRYMKVTKDRINTFESVLMSRQDIHFDFIEAKIDVPVAEGDDKKINYMSINYSTASSSDSIFAKEDDDTPINDIENLKEEFIKYRDNDKLWNDDILKKSIIEYRVPTDQSLLAELTNDISIYENEMKSEDVMIRYSDILSGINSEITQKISENMLDGDINDKSISEEIVMTAPQMDENSDPTEVGEDIGTVLDNLMDSVMGNN